MKRQSVFFTELAYVFGILALALGTALMERADFGVSMVVAPAYLLFRRLSQLFPVFTFGMAEYTLQACLLVVLCLVLRRFRVSFLFSFVTAVVYGLTLDGCIALIALLPGGGMAARLAWYLVGMLVCAVGVSLLFHTYLAPEVYELFVKELSAKTGADIHRVKTVYDCCSCAVAVALSFAFFGLWHFEGVKLGTVLCALVNGSLIGVCTHLLEARFVFRDALPLRRWFA
ncbi:MAG: DUF6198 family protein [Oscillospiraceae bacterium]|nr:DUF6198 family protein [Oscillospiraceae bacterium]